MVKKILVSKIICKFLSPQKTRFQEKKKADRFTIDIVSGVSGIWLLFGKFVDPTELGAGITYGFGCLMDGLPETRGSIEDRFFFGMLLDVAYHFQHPPTWNNPSGETKNISSFVQVFGPAGLCLGMVARGQGASESDGFLLCRTTFGSSRQALDWFVFEVFNHDSYIISSYLSHFTGCKYS